MTDRAPIPEGVRAFREGRYFDAHEHWETAWRSTEDPAVRSALQGLVQLAASLYKAERGERRGHEKLWDKARARLSTARSLGTLGELDLAELDSLLPKLAPGRGPVDLPLVCETERSASPVTPSDAKAPGRPRPAHRPPADGS